MFEIDVYGENKGTRVEKKDFLEVFSCYKRTNVLYIENSLWYTVHESFGKKNLWYLNACKWGERKSLFT